MALKDYIKEMLDPLASVTPLCALVGIFAASLYVKINIFDAALILIAMLFANISVNIMNDYADYKSGLDKETVHTKFSGGRAGLIVNGTIKPRKTRMLAFYSLLIALAIGIKFMVAMPILALLAIFGMLVILFYTSKFANIPYLPEILIAITYSLVPIGSFIAMTNSLVHLASIAVLSVPIGIAVAMVLLINEIPDRGVDKKYGRKSAAVLMHSPRSIAYYYLAWQTAAMFTLLYGAAFGLTSITTLLPLLAMPLVLKIFKGAIRYREARHFEKVMGINVLFFILFAALLIIGIAYSNKI